MMNRSETTRTNNSFNKIELQLVPSDHVFSFRVTWWDLLGERHQHDIAIHAITLINHSSEVVSVESITIDGTYRGNLLQRTVFDKEEIRKWTRPMVARHQLGLRRVLDLILGTDLVVSPDKELSTDTELKTGQLLILPNVYLTYHKWPDKINISVRCRINTTREKVILALPVVEYTSSLKYSMPLEGIWLMKGTPNTGVLDHHRFNTSGEFGVDFIRLGPNGEIFKNEAKQASDYYGYGENVFAAADGTIVALVNNEVQEWTRFSPREGETEEEFQKRQLIETQKALKGDVGKWFAGNYIIIQHSLNEYSAYLHLRENSIRVKEGDVVQRGQYIADVGNTGDTFGAHLHFQVLDRPNIILGRSLPFEFENVDVLLSEPGLIVRKLARVSF